MNVILDWLLIAKDTIEETQLQRTLFWAVPSPGMEYLTGRLQPGQTPTNIFEV